MDMGKSSEAEISASESLAIDYDVFLSFRGLDTRQGFVDYLYHDMQEANIRVFLDEEELHVGKEIADELPTAIKKSKIYLPIFSKGYASSAWCLRELTHMVECKKSKPSKKEIMPIFYKVEPRDVKLKEWKFIKLIIQEILMKLKVKDKYVPVHLVGMDDAVEEVLKLLDVNSGGKPFLLIHGMGGIGKTTLAKIVFNKLNSLFSYCCFLNDVRESSLKTLQKRLLSDMFGLGDHDMISDVDDGIKVITDRLHKRKVLVVLDDVNEEEQLEKLAIKHVSFTSGSKVIMTTRNTRLVVIPNQTLEYEMKPLDPNNSLELFSRYAFARNSPPDDYVSLSRQIVSTASGLPLALEVIGSLLRHQSKDFWSEIRDKLRGIPHEKVQDKLKISYDVLNTEQKEIFLDIACLFVDKDKTNAFYMWKDCNFFPNSSIQVLISSSLIKITDDKRFWMHDQLKDLRRKIVCGDTRPMDPKKQSRLWDPQTAKDIIKTEEIKEAIEAINLRAPENYTNEDFSRLPNIRFLELRKGCFNGDFKNKLSKLRYLSWSYCPEEFVAINFHPSNLVVLKLSFSSITENSAGWSQIKVAKKLKVLNLSRCDNMTRTPNFSDYLNLERLILKKCYSLIEVDCSLEKLKCLIYFNANGCSNLTELPEGIGQLEKLKYLYLGNCKKLRKLPKSFGRVASLVELDLSNTAITRLPSSVGNQKHLSVLKLQDTKINELPRSIGNLQELKSLFLSSCEKIIKLPVSIGKLKFLLELDVSSSKCLWLPESIGNLSRLKVINISHCYIRDLPRSILTLKELEELHAVGCLDLKWEIPEDIYKLLLLRVLYLQYTPIRNVPKTIEQLPRLEKLGLCGCSELKLFPELPTSLISLSFGSRSLQKVPNLSNLTQLEELRYCGNYEKRHHLSSEDGPSQQSLEFLPPSVSTLALENHNSLTGLSFGCNFRKLTHLRMSQCLWKEVQLNGLEWLIEFEVEGLKKLKGFVGLASLKRLKLLTLFDCPNITVVQGLGLVESLEQLEIKCCPKIASLDDLSNLKKLEALTIRDCEELLVINGLDELETLKRLDLASCRSLRSFPNVFNSKIPEECFLDIIGCPNLEEDSFRGTFSEKRRNRQREKERGRRVRLGF
ncbi:hypothetical protein ACJRO7_021159 [Eucalyptus globulus]|uniref:TIR domain-containing protein n=1 Tax=Eucalyptus globulus TaxID=34317 RepID=A0ABD3KJM6_EUCGL